MRRLQRVDLVLHAVLEVPNLRTTDELQCACVFGVEVERGFRPVEHQPDLFLILILHAGHAVRLGISPGFFHAFEELAVNFRDFLDGLRFRFDERTRHQRIRIGILGQLRRDAGGFAAELILGERGVIEPRLHHRARLIAHLLERLGPSFVSVRVHRLLAQEAAERGIVLGSAVLISAQQHFTETRAQLRQRFLVFATGRVREFVFQFRQLRLEVRIFRRLFRRRDERTLLRLHRAAEHTVQRVVIFRRDGVELMVVATGARDRQAHETLRHHIDAVIDHVLLVAHEAFAHRKEAHRRHVALVVTLHHAVCGDLFQDELVEWLVLVEGLDDIVAIRPGKRIVRRATVQAVTGVIRITRHVQPVTAPALTVTWRGQITVHHLRKGVRGLVLDEIFHFLRRRRQTDEVISRAADERTLVDLRRRGQPLFLELLQDETVHIRLHKAALVRDFRHRRVLDRLERPMAAGFLDADGLHRGSGPDAGIRRTHLHPSDEIRHLFIGQAVILLGRHLQVFIMILHRFDEQTLLRIARHHGWTTVATLEQAFLGIDHEPAFHFRIGGGAVAVIAGRGKHRADAFLEKLQLLRIQFRIGGTGTPS